MIPGKDVALGAGGGGATGAGGLGLRGSKHKGYNQTQITVREEKKRPGGGGFRKDIRKLMDLPSSA